MLVSAVVCCPFSVLPSEPGRREDGVPISGSLILGVVAMVMDDLNG